MIRTKTLTLTAAALFASAGCASMSHREAAEYNRPRMEAREGQEGTAFISAENIQKAQTVLQKLGYDPGRANGQMTDQTEEALRDFQRSERIPVTGSLDVPTVKHLEKHGANFTGTLCSLEQRRYE